MMFLKGFVLLLLLVMMVQHGSGNSSGAPSAACINLTPGHGATPQQGTPPYTITFTPSTFTPGGSPITVTLTTTSGNTFMGFLLTAQYEGPCADQTLKPGTFSTPANTKLVCSNGAVTHSAVNTQNSLTFQWTPPATSDYDVRFRATFVQSLNVYWVNVPASNLLTNSAPSSGGQSNCTTSGPAAATGTVSKDSACGQTKGCYSDCSGNTCNFLMTWAPGTAADNIEISMSAVMANVQGKYIAFGLSNDDEMGADSVTYCINAANGVYNAYNDGKTSRLLTNPQQGLANINVNYADGVLTCTFTQLRAADSSGERYALDKTYTLFWASGPGAAGGIGMHEDIPLVSTQAASLEDFTADVSGGIDYPLVKVHGSLMMIAWVFAASLGIVFARYFKNVWEDKSWFGQKIWFQIHRGCMILVLLATVTAFIIIFVDVEGYSHIHGAGYKRAHPVIGIIVTVLTVVNPIMALFRPHPGTANRPIFNWLHWGVGTAGYTLAIITIFFGIELEKAAAPSYTIYIMVAFVAWQFLIQVLLELAQCMGRNSVKVVNTPPHNQSGKGEEKGEAPNDNLELTDIAGGRSSKPSRQKDSTFKKRVLLVIHVIVVTAFTVALLVVLNVGDN